nr:unnamed protein product [Callosobruchus chinensis]
MAIILVQNANRILIFQTSNCIQNMCVKSQYLLKILKCRKIECCRPRRAYLDYQTTGLKEVFCIKIIIFLP